MATIDCIPRDTLKQYLAGWMDESHAAEIEQHLESCEACEHTVVELESKPDTVFEPLGRPLSTSPGPSESDNSLRDAVAKAEQLISPGQPNSNDLQSFPSTLGPYELIRSLGHGGMGTVYLARHKKLDKQVAVKLMPQSWSENEEAAARFRREILATGKLNHASIVTATDAGDQAGIHYLVMEYVEGVDLSQLVRVVDRLSIADCCEMMRHVALGLSHAHAGGIVHRDVKPSNVMLSNRGEVKVLDFGLAQFNPWDDIAAELTTVGQLMGTLDYMAPEQAERPNAVDYRADLYALGATLFRLLAGRPPLAAAPNLSPIDKLRLLATHHAPRLDTLRPDSPPALVSLVSAMLERQPESRPPSAAHIAEQLAPFCKDADLVGLAARARTAVENDEKISRVARNRPWSAARATLSPSAIAASTPPRKSIGWIALAALLSLLIFAGVLVVLETRKGQLVIESEVPGVHVKVLSEGKVVEDLRIDTGTTSTKLAADKYEIVLDSPSDAITVDKNQFVLKSGDTIVARIRQRPADAAVPGESSSLTSARYTDEQTYEGKTLDSWLAQLARERSKAAIGEALKAVEALAQEDNADRVTKTIVAALPRLGDVTTPEGYTAYHILARINPGPAYMKLLVDLLNSADAKFGNTILSMGPRPRFGSADGWEPLFQWIEQNPLAESPPNATVRELAEPSAWAIRRLIAYGARDPQEVEKIEQRFLPLMEKSSHVGPHFWLTEFPQGDIQKLQQGVTWSKGFREAVIRQAIKAIQTESTAPQYAAQASIILTQILSAQFLPRELNLEHIAQPVADRIALVANEPARLMQLTEVDSPFERFAVPANTMAHFRGGVSRGKASEIIELMDLAYALKEKGVQFPFPIDRVAKVTQASYLKVLQSLPTRGPRPANMEFDLIQISWPGLDAYQVRGGRPPPNPFTFDELLGFIICVRASQVGGLPLPGFDKEGNVVDLKEQLNQFQEEPKSAPNNLAEPTAVPSNKP